MSDLGSAHGMLRWVADDSRVDPGGNASIPFAIAVPGMSEAAVRVKVLVAVVRARPREPQFGTE